MFSLLVSKAYNRWLRAMHNVTPRRIMVSVVLAIGLFSEIFLWDGAFSRSGSILVIFAVLLIYGQPALERQIEYYRSVQQDYGSYVQAKAEIAHGEETGFAVESQTESGMKSFTIWNLPEQIERNKEKVWEYEISNVIIPTLEEAKSRSSLIECVLGSAGTFIWGFGDIVPTLC